MYICRYQKCMSQSDGGQCLHYIHLFVVARHKKTVPASSSQNGFFFSVLDAACSPAEVGRTSDAALHRHEALKRTAASLSVPQL